MDSQTLEISKQAGTSAAEMLRQWREGIGLSQNDVARLAGVSQAYISQIENSLSEIGGQLKAFLEAVKRRRDRCFPIH